MKRLAVLLVALFSAAVLAQDLPKIAVYVTGNVPDDEKKALGTRMLATLINSGRYKGIERSNSFLAEVEKEQVKQRSGAIDDSQISELGRQFGVKFVCIADITPAFGEYQVSARVVDVETAEVAFIGESFSPLKSPADLVAVSNQVVKNMFGDQAAPSAAQTYTVTVNINPVNGGYVARSVDKAAYDAWETLTLTAVANSGYEFTGWSGASNSENPVLAGQINGDLNLTANFRPSRPAYTLSVTVSPQGGGAVARSPDRETYGAGETVSVTATSAGDYKFTGWSGAVTSRKTHVTVTMDADKTLTANFYQKSIPPPNAPKPPAKPKPEPGAAARKTFAVGGGLFCAADLAGGLRWNGGAGILGMPYQIGGAYLFLDASYAAAWVGYAVGGGKWETPNVVDYAELPYMSRASLNLGVSAKYPNLINASVTVAGAEILMKVYPAVGIDYEFPTSAQLEYDGADPYAFDGGNKDGYNADVLSAIWVRFGAGLDVHITENVFIRAELFYGARMSNQFELDKTTASGADMPPRLGHGPTFKAGAGFKL